MRSNGKYARPRIIVVGAGFGGLWAARTLANTPTEVHLIDRQNHHTFLPLLYQVAAAELAPAEIAYPVRGIVRRLPNVHFTMDEVKGVDLKRKTVKTTRLQLPYDFLVLSLGSVPQYFNIPGAAEHTFSLKSLDEGIALRNHILSCFEHAATESNEQKRRALLTFVIVGGGATGVEFAGALAELIRGPLRKDFPELDFREVCILLLEAREALLPGMPEPLQEYTLHRLQRMGVEVYLNTPVQAVEAGQVIVQGQPPIPAETVVWTAGVQGNRQAAMWGLPTNQAGRVLVTPTLQVPGYPEVYVIGDLAYLEADRRPLPMMAPVAIQQGEAAARNILRQIQGKPPLPFTYRDRGTMVTIGRNAAVAHVFGRSLTGFPAWLTWVGVHLLNLIGFRNRLIVLLNWAWDYFLYEKAVRLILPGPTQPPRSTMG